MHARLFQIIQRGPPFPGRALLDWLRTPQARWVVPAVTALLAVCMTLFAQAVRPPSRVATARVALDPSAAGEAAAAQQWVATQVALIHSERVARQVMQDLGLGVASAYFGFVGDDASTQLLSNLQVEPEGQGGLVSIRYRSSNAAFSAQIANAFVAAYDRVSQEMQAGIAAAAMRRARQRLSELRDALDVAQARVQAAENVDLRADTAALVEAARVARLTSQAAWSGLREAGRSAGRQSVLGNSEAAEDAPQSDLAGIAASPAQLRSARDELDLAQQTFAAAQARFSELNGQQIFGRSAVAIVDAAEALDAGRYSPMIVWIAALAGLAAGLCLRPLVQWIDPRVRNSRDLISTLGLPVFGALVNAERAAKGARASRRAHRGLIDAPRAVPALP